MLSCFFSLVIFHVKLSFVFFFYDFCILMWCVGVKVFAALQSSTAELLFYTVEQCVQ